MNSLQRSAIQRLGGTVNNNETTLAEGQSALVSTGGKISYTALAAGCMAITVSLAGGGGAGVHLTIDKYQQEDTAAQFQQLRQIIGNAGVTRVCVVCDAFNNWFFEFGLDEDLMPAFIANAPRGVANSENPDDARYASSDASARSWAEAVFKCRNVSVTWSKTAGPYQF